MSGVETLPCGCRCGQVGATFWYEPCADDCEHFQFVLAEAGRQDKPTTIVDMR